MQAGESAYYERGPPEGSQETGQEHAQSVQLVRVEHVRTDECLTQVLLGRGVPSRGLGGLRWGQELRLPSVPVTGIRALLGYEIGMY